MKWLTLATEDSLSEAVGLRLIKNWSQELGVKQSIHRNGFGYLRSRLQNFCQMARREPVFLLTDLDKKDCAPSLVAEWFGTKVCPKQLIFRVAVREVEAWLLADHDAIRQLLKRKALPLPHDPDQLADPKRFLISLAEKAPREIKEELVPEKGALSTQGLGYNNVLVNFVHHTWDPLRAEQRSESLRKARQRLAELVE